MEENKIMRQNRFFSRRGREVKDEFETKLLDLARVTHVRAGGKKLRFRAIIIAGNKLGKVGLGVAKGSDVAQAVEKATRLAKKISSRSPSLMKPSLTKLMLNLGQLKFC